MRTLLLAGACLELLSVPALADGDVIAGEKVFQVCVSCHSLDGKADKIGPHVGPHLVGIVGRPVAAVEGYAYSDTMEAFGAAGAVWDETTLDKFLKEPVAVVPRTKMMFAPVIRRESERADVIAFLKSKQ